MSNYSKKVVIDALGFYRLNAVDVLCCKESLDAFKANNDFAIEFGKLFEFLVNTKLTKMSLTKRISYRAFVYIKMVTLYSSAYKKLIMDKAVYEKIVSYTQKLYEQSVKSDLKLHYANTNWKFIPHCIYKMYLKYVLCRIVENASKKNTLKFEESMK